MPRSRTIPPKIPGPRPSGQAVGRSRRRQAPKPPRALRVGYYGTYDLREGCPRNRFLIDALLSAGVEVVELHRAIWNGDDPRRGALRRALTVGPQWAWAHAWLPRELRKVDLDVVVVGHPGFVDLVPTRWFSLRRGVPLVLDVSGSSPLLDGPKRLAPGHPVSRLLRAAGRRLLRRPDLVLTDTGEQARFLHQRHRVPVDRLAVLPLGSALPTDDEPPEAPPGFDPDCLSVLFVGSYSPLEGVRTIIEAASALRKIPITFTLVGCGREYAGMQRAALDLGLENVTFVEPWVPEDVLDHWIRASDVCLGVFGDLASTGSVFPAKAHDALARGKAIVTVDSPAIRELLVDRESALLVPPMDALALASALRELCDDPDLQRHLAEGAARVYERFLNLDVVGRRYRETLEDLVADHRRARTSR